MSWIKINTALPKGPKIVRLATLMGVSEREALGLALEWLCWLDAATADGCTGLRKAEIDRIFTCHANCVTGVSRKKRDQIREEKNINNKHPKEAINTVCGGATAETGLSMGRALPETSDEVLTYIAALPNCGLTGDELTACVETFFSQSEAVGWTLSGQPIRDWRASARAFLAKWQNNIASRAAAAPRAGKITYRSETQQNYEL